MQNRMITCLGYGVKVEEEKGKKSDCRIRNLAINKWMIAKYSWGEKAVNIITEFLLNILHNLDKNTDGIMYDIVGYFFYDT